MNKMAEKYGTIPKKFTKEWWDYFWTYYKWHTLIIVLVICMVTGTIYGKMTAEKFDITLTYAGKGSVPQEISEVIEEKLSPLCPDIDQNGEPNLLFQQFNLANAESDPEYAMAMTTKLQMTFGEDEAYIYILDEDLAKAYMGETADSCVFAPVDDWLTEDINNPEFLSAHGKNYGVKLTDCKLLNESGADFSERYLFIRYYPRKDQIKRQLDGYKGAIQLANKILISK